jgi:hypothetical protein
MYKKVDIFQIKQAKDHLKIRTNHLKTVPFNSGHKNCPVWYLGSGFGMFTLLCFVQNVFVLSNEKLEPDWQVVVGKTLEPLSPLRLEPP